MRRVFITAVLLLLGLGSASAQHYFGVRGGAGNGSVRFYPPRETGAIWGLYSGGVSWKYYTRETMMGGIEVDLLYMQKGYKQIYAQTPDTAYYHRVNSIELPIFMQPHFYLGGRTVRLFLNLGVSVNYNLDASYQIKSGKDGILEEGPYEMLTPRDNRWGYGLCGGFGFNYIMNRLEFMGEVRYNFGYGDIYRHEAKYPGNPQRSPLDNMYIHAGVYYRMGKGDILSKPSAKAAQKIQERENKRIQRQAEKMPMEGSDIVDPPGHPAPEAAPAVVPDTQPAAQPAKEPVEKQDVPAPVTPENEKQE